MIEVLKTQVPEGMPGASYKDEKVISYPIKDGRVFCIGHEVQERIELELGGEEQQKTRTVQEMVAFQFTVPSPVTRARAITAAEMAAYNLITPLDVASFNAGLARKSREGVDIKEVQDHDEFIGWVKEELTKIGV